MSRPLPCPPQKATAIPQGYKQACEIGYGPPDRSTARRHIGPNVIGTYPGSLVAKKSCDVCDSPRGMGLLIFFVPKMFLLLTQDKVCVLMKT